MDGWTWEGWPAGPECQQMVLGTRQDPVTRGLTWWWPAALKQTEGIFQTSTLAVGEEWSLGLHDSMDYGEWGWESVPSSWGTSNSTTQPKISSLMRNNYDQRSGGLSYCFLIWALSKSVCEDRGCKNVIITICFAKSQIFTLRFVWFSQIPQVSLCFTVSFFYIRFRVF